MYKSQLRRSKDCIQDLNVNCTKGTMPISSLASRSSSSAARNKRKGGKIAKPSQADKFSHSILLRNRLVREYLSRFSQQKWNEAIKYAVIAGIQSFLLMEHEQNEGSVGLTLEELEEQILRGKAAIALKKNLKEVNQALQTVKDDVATMEETINTDSGVVEDEQPLAGRRLAKFPFVDEFGGVANIMVQQEVPSATRKQRLTSESAQGVVSKILSESNRNTLGIKLNNQMRDKVRNPIYPGWWPDDHVTEATNRARGLPKPKPKKREQPRLSYSVKRANENVNVLANDLVTEAYIDVPSSGYKEGYVPPRATREDRQRSPSSKMNISTKPFTVKERVLSSKKTKDVTSRGGEPRQRGIPKYLKNVSSKVKAQVNAYKAAAKKAQQEQKEVIEEIMSPARAPLPGREYNLTHNNQVYMADSGRDAPMHKIADAFLDEYNGLVEDGPSPRDLNLDPWSDADVYVPVKNRKKNGFDGAASKNTNSIIADIEKSYNEREFRSRRFRPTFEGWVGEYGPTHTHGRKGTKNVLEGDDYYIDGDMVEDEITKQKTDEILLSRQHDADESLNIKKFLSPVPRKEDETNPASVAENVVAIEKTGTGDTSGNGRIGDPVLLPVNLATETETVEDTIVRSNETIKKIAEAEAESQMKIIEMESALNDTAGK